ncbi:hypothetical protein UA08_01440 [Talaromyces atroroseus]|uniref:Thioesterase domain-containing protein n=1 Tax=Talaromyces atroroseus TaxID=1441469 RepID=A0A1Q5QA86_TALAT|nr:hypothetical protein UA08_01440 [Talaromyces atroroseus]OKL62830.1 hypothetical protein UA08_01440 [Talaromyces atroroseus]
MFRASRTYANALLYGGSRPRSCGIPAQLAPLKSVVRNYTTALTGPASNTRTATTSKWTRRFIYAALFGSIGYYTGHAYTTGYLFPAIPGSPEDVQKTQQIQQLVEYLPIVRKLRADPKYVEWDAYESFTEEYKSRRLSSGPLRGSRGLAVQKIFWNEEDKECVNVVYFGHGLDGWLSVVHGGLLATVLDESLGRVALRSVPAKTGVTAHLSVGYRAPVSTGEFYTIHTSLDKERSSDRKAYVNGEIRSLAGKLCCESDALFVVPKNFALQEIGDRF